ncbi:MAG TPA: phosphatidylglycerophosphatase A [Solimonas sp.]|nr:phosphatidylglycerophosphatase A [Solimonas sp.]
MTRRPGDPLVRRALAALAEVGRKAEPAPGFPVPKPPPELILTTPEHLLAFGLGAGLSPVGPGTVGTLVGVLMWLALCWLPWPAYAVAVLALFVLGCWLCGASARLLGVPDYGGIVFDEIVGFQVAALPLVPALGWIAEPKVLWVALAFGLFRLFDIWKPWPIRALDRGVHDGLGIMLDDVLAGIYAAAILAALGAL